MTKEDYIQMPVKEWNGLDALYSAEYDIYFFDKGELDDYLYDYELALQDLKLIICEPVTLPELTIDGFADYLPTDTEYSDPEWLVDAVYEFNEAIRGKVCAWKPGGFRCDPNSSIFYNQ